MNNDNNDYNFEEINDDDLVLLVFQILSEMHLLKVQAVAAMVQTTQTISRHTQIVQNCVIEYNTTMNALYQVALITVDEDIQRFLFLTNATHMQCRVTYPRLDSNKGYWEVWHPQLIDDEVDNSRPTMKFKYHYRMSRRTFSWLCQLLQEHPEFQLVAHNATPVYQQIASVLWRFGSCHLGYMMQKAFLGFAHGSYNNFTNRFLNAITGLASRIIVWPTSDTAVQQAAEDFEYPQGREVTQPANKKLPGCIGIVDGKLVNIHKPRRNAKSLRDRKGNLSINLIAVCDSFQQFTYIYVGESSKELTFYNSLR